MQDDVLIAHMKKDENLFILDLVIPEKVMQAST